MTVAPVIACPECQGLTFVLRTCRCRDGDGGPLIDFDRVVRSAAGPEAPPWPDCQLCHGDGTVSGKCYGCDGRGRRRAQLVLTVANRETGQVASVNLVQLG